MRRQVNRRDCILQRKTVRDEVRQIESVAIAIEDQPVDILIERHRRAVGPHQRLLVHADGCRIERRLSMLRLSEQHDASTRPDRIHRHFDQRIATDRKQSDISTASFRSGLGCSGNVSPRIERMIEPKLCGNRVALRIQIAGQHGRSGPSCQSGQQNADRSLTDHQHCLVRLQIEQLDRLVAGIDRLKKCRLLKRNLVGNLHQTAPHNPVHHADVLGEAAAGRRKARGASYLLVDLALREGLLAAVVAFAAGDVMVRHHAVADCEAAYALAYPHNRPRHLMPEDTRRIVRAGMNLLQVRPADSAGVDLDQHLAGADLGHRNRLDTNIVHPAIDRGTHGGWHRINVAGYFRFE